MAIFTYLEWFSLVPRQYHKVILFWASLFIDGTIYYKYAQSPISKCTCFSVLDLWHLVDGIKMGWEWSCNDDKSVFFGEFWLWCVSTVSIWNILEFMCGDWLMSVGKFLLQMLPCSRGWGWTPVPVASVFGWCDCLVSDLPFVLLLCVLLWGCLFSGLCSSFLSCLLDFLPLLGLSKWLLAAFKNLLILVWEGHTSVFKMSK